MKRILLIISIAYCFTMLTQAAVTKTVTLYSAGLLRTSLTSTELTTVTNLTVNGIVDARDFRTMKDLMTSLIVIDLSNTVVVAYSGTQGTLYNNANVYLADEIPIVAFDARVEAIILPKSIIGLSSYAIEATKITSITIPNGVTYIGKNAFNNCSSLISVSFPGSLKSIGEYAFSNCGLSAIVMPNSVTSVGMWAFSDCSNLASVQLSESLTTINGGVFKKCRSITSIDIPASVKSINSSAFENCAFLTSVTLPEGLQTIGNSAFYYCISLEAIELPSTLTTINRSAFRECDLKSISIPASVTSIGENAFENNYSLATIHAFGTTPVDLSTSTDVFKNVNHVTCIVNVPPGKSTIYKSAAEWTGFTNIVDKSYSLSLPISIINATAASGTTNLAVTSNTYWVASSNLSWISLEDSTDYGNGTIKIKVAANTSTIARSGQVLVTGSGASSKQITVNQAASTVSLLSVSTPFIKFDDYSTKTVTLKIISNIGWHLTSDSPWVTLSKTSGAGNDEVIVTVEANEMLSMRMATISVSGNNVPTVKTYVGQGESSILAVTPGGLSSKINDWEKESITKLTLTGTLDARDFKFMRDSITNLSILDISKANIVEYTGTEGTENGTLTYGANTIPIYAFYNNSTSKGKTTLTEVNLPTSTTAIDAFSFQSCTNLTKIELHEGLKTIGSASFRYCSGLMGIDFPFTVNVIGSSSFFGCLNISEFYIPSGVTAINGYTFSGCTALEKVYIPSSVTTISARAFRDCRALTEIYANPVTPVDISASTDVFSNVDRFHCKLLVPNASISAYRAANVWKEFLNIANVSTSTPLMSISASTFNVTNAKAIKTVTITANTYGLISTDQDWIVLGQKNYSGTTILSFEIKDNLTRSSRIAIITISAEGAASKQITITQAAGSPYLLSGPISLSYNSALAAKATLISSNLSWTASSDASWLTISASSGNGDCLLVCTAAANSSTTSRTAKVTLSASDVSSRVVNITQAAYITTGIGISEKEMISVYPNPTKGLLYINSKDEVIENIKISDLNGRVLMEKVEFNSGEAIDISEFEGQVFIISIQIGKSIYFHKIMKN